MKLFSNIFGAKNSNYAVNQSKYSDTYFKGKEAYQLGRQLFSESVDDKSISDEQRKLKITAAVEFLDQALENGYREAEVYLIRGNCLRDLNYDLDALDDFNNCIELDPERANFYYDRALTKQFIYDLDGALLDFRQAIELSKLKNENTSFWNKYAKETGFESATARYEFDVYFVLRDLESAKTSVTMQSLIKNKRSEIKRRIK